MCEVCVCVCVCGKFLAQLCYMCLLGTGDMNSQVR